MGVLIFLLSRADAIHNSLFTEEMLSAEWCVILHCFHSSQGQWRKHYIRHFEVGILMLHSALCLVNCVFLRYHLTRRDAMFSGPHSDRVTYQPGTTSHALVFWVRQLLGERSGKSDSDSADCKHVWCDESVADRKKPWSFQRYTIRCTVHWWLYSTLS